VTDPILKGIGALALVGGDVAIDFTNTVHRYDREDQTDELQTYGDFVEWSQKAGVIAAGVARKLRVRATDETAAASRALARTRSLRRAIYDVFDALAQDDTPDRSDVKVVQGFWTEAIREADLVWGGDQFDFQFDVKGDTLNEPLFPIAHAAIRLLTSDEAKRVRGCLAVDCTWLFVDRSKNASRRWCQMEVCGNREKAKRHYRRARSAS
jgi:predicted RNA-binding Zn ribbon-like protein